MKKQLTLSVGLKDEATFENYFSPQNAGLVTALKRAASAEGEAVIYFYGVGGLGRTHLTQACCHYADRFGQNSIYLALAHLQTYTPDLFDGLERLNLVCVDDVHLLAGQAPWEEAFFHFYNRMRDAGGRLVLSAKSAPKASGFVLPDLASRLTAGVVYALQALSDAEKLEILIKRAQGRGLHLSEEVARFILTHSPRHMSTLFAALDTLDKESLATKRRPTIPFIKEVLEI